MALVFLSLNVSFVTTALDKLVVLSLKSEEREPSHALQSEKRQRGEVTGGVFKPGMVVLKPTGRSIQKRKRLTMHVT